MRERSKLLQRKPVLSSQGCSNAVLAPLLACTPVFWKPAAWSQRVSRGLQQAFGKNFVVSADYI
jgi:hypothetical protein